MKYIDAEKLKAEIEKRLSIFEYGMAYDCWASCKKVVESLQQEQPEVDLEREIIRYKVPFSDDREYLNEQTLDAIARHFWNKGYNARKEK